jgi:predicted DNA-binding protein (MmcQ/YjbR family)
MMDELGLRDYCLSKRGAEETFPFGSDVRVIKVSSKMFALIPVGEATVSISLKCEPTWAQILRNTYAAVKPGYHLNKEYWNSIYMDGTISNDEVLTMIDHSYDQVIKSLTKAQRKALETS